MEYTRTTTECNTFYAPVSKSGYIENYTYNDHNMRLTARRYNGTDPNSPGSAAPAYNQTFSYNTYGDRIAEWYGDGNDDPNLAIAFNALNLPIYGYESTDPNNPNYAVKTYTYDDDQNLVADSNMIYRYDAENRLIEAEPNKDPNDMDPNSDFFTSYTYDYLSRVVRERRYEWDSYTLDWEATPAVDQRFMYYKRMKLLTLGLDDDEVVPLYKFVYGPGTDGRLGGPGSLLAIRDVSGGGTLDLLCFHNGGGKLVDLAVRDTGDIYENYELVVNRGAYEGGCWSPPWSPSCDACGDCFSGWWVDTRIAQPGAPGYCMDVAVPVCHCGDPSSDPGTQRVEPGVDDSCIKTGSPTGCGGIGDICDGPSCDYTDEDICAIACNQGGACDGMWGCVMCTPDGRGIACHCAGYSGGIPGNGPPPPNPCDNPQGPGDCIFCHEQTHIDNEYPSGHVTCDYCDNPQGCRPQWINTSGPFLFDPLGQFVNAFFECLSLKKERECLNKVDCNMDFKCLADKQEELESLDKAWNSNSSPVCNVCSR